MHTGNKLEALRALLQNTSPPLDSNGELQMLQTQDGRTAPQNMLAALDWDGRMDLSKKPKKQPGAKATPIDRMRWDLFDNPGPTLHDVAEEQAKGMRSPRHTCITRHSILTMGLCLLWLYLLCRP